MVNNECLWYNGEEGCYELLDFDPNGLSNSLVFSKAKQTLKDKYGFDGEDLEKASETIYLIDIDNLIKLKL